MKIKKIDELKENYLKKFHKGVNERLFDLKIWSDLKSPDVIKPALSYALGWLSPDVLGSGFRILQLDDQMIKALIPARTLNLNDQNEIQMGLIINAAHEVIKTFINHHWELNAWFIGQQEITITKKSKWDSDLEVELSFSESDLDQFLIQLQKSKTALFETEIKISSRIQNKLKSLDSLKIKFEIHKRNLLK